MFTAPLGLPRLFWILWVGQFINRLGGFVLTFLPLFLTEHHRYTDARAGAVLSLFGLGSLLGASLGGWSADRFGRRITVLVGTSVGAVVVFTFGFAPAGIAISILSFLHGVSSAYGPALTAAVADVVGPHDRARAFGYFYWAINLGFAVAALLGGAISRHGYAYLFVGDAATTVALAAIVLKWVPETRPVGAVGRKAAALSELPRALIDPRFVGFAAAQLLVLFVFLQSFVALPLQERAAGVPVSSIGLIAALNGGVIIVCQPVFLRFTAGQPSWKLLTLASSLVGLAALVAAFAHDLRGFAASMVVVSLGEVAFSSAAPSFVAHVAPIDRRGTFQGAYSLCWASASMLAPLVGPAARQRHGNHVAWGTAAALCALSAGLHAWATRRAEAASQPATA